MNDVVVAVGFGLVTAGILALSAVALSLQFTVSKFPNFSHGEMMTVGAYAAFVVQHVTSNLVIEAIAATAAGALFGYITNRFVLQQFIRRNAKGLVLFTVTIAVSIIVQSLLLAFFGGANVHVAIPSSTPNHLGPFLFTTYDLIIMALAVVIMFGVHAVLRYTTFGKSQRAVADNRDLARVTGINTARVVELTWALAGALAGFAGFILATAVGSFGPGLGYSFLVVIFAAVVVGEIGNIYGAILGALLVGVSMEVSALYIPSSYKNATAFALLVLTLLLRPHGLFTRKVEVA